MKFSSSSLYDSLKDGVILCEFLNKIQPGTVKKINTSTMPFKQMENVAAYIEGSRKLGVPDEYNFVTVDLFEGKNLAQVVENIRTLKRITGHGFQKQIANPTATVPLTSDQTTDSKSQEQLISRNPQQLKSENDVKRTGRAMLSGRQTNESAMRCLVCTQFITSGAVNALNKTWHPNCFCCKKCNVKLSTTKYYEYSDNPYCERCILMVNPQTSVKGVTTDKGFKFGAVNNPK